jgi:NADH:ubiquinone oxidoreductase subunit 6 (subunit J)
MPATKGALLAGSATAADGEATDSDRGSVDLLAENHVARLGGELFGRHLLAVEVAGVLLLVALIGSIAIVSRGGSGGGFGDGDARATRRAVS